MAKQKLFPEKAPDNREPHERFNELARKIVTASKSVVDEREKQWRKSREEQGRNKHR